METFDGTIIQWCDDCGTYHEYSVWMKGNGHVYLSDGSGDVYPISAKELRAERAAQVERWQDYYQGVADGGEDYLMAVHVNEHEQQVWFLVYEEDANGLKFVRGQREGDGVWMTPGDWKMPQGVWRYATADYEHTAVPLNGAYVDGITTLAQLRDVLASNVVATLVGDNVVKTVIQTRKSDAVIQAAKQHEARMRAADQHADQYDQLPF